MGSGDGIAAGVHVARRGNRSTLHAVPLLVKSSRAALESVDRACERAGRSLGASEWRIFWRVSLPLARRPIAAATALAFARSLGDFGATLMIAGDIPGRTQTAAIAIYDAVESGNTLVARALVIVISVVTAAIVFLANRLERRRRDRMIRAAIDKRFAARRGVGWISPQRGIRSRPPALRFSTARAAPARR